jgi:uncharacterized glyoxalase superfamily protein PhnB
VTVAVQVYVDDVDAHYERAKAAGATINAELDDRDYGDRRYDASDLEGLRTRVRGKTRESDGPFRAWFATPHWPHR